MSGPSLWDWVWIPPTFSLQVTKGALYQDTYLLLQPLLKERQQIQIMIHCISHPATGTGHALEAEVPSAR